MAKIYSNLKVGENWPKECGEYLSFLEPGQGSWCE